MVELGELEKEYAAFQRRNVRVIAVSDDDQPTAQVTQADFPHLVVLADTDQAMAQALDVIHPGAGHDGGDTNAPTLFLVDGQGRVEWVIRPDRFVRRLSPQEVLQAIDEGMK